MIWTDLDKDTVMAADNTQTKQSSSSLGWLQSALPNVCWSPALHRNPFITNTLLVFPPLCHCFWYFPSLQQFLSFIWPKAKGIHSFIYIYIHIYNIYIYTHTHIYIHTYTHTHSTYYVPDHQWIDTSAHLKQDGVQVKNAISRSTPPGLESWPGFQCVITVCGLAQGA